MWVRSKIPPLDTICLHALTLAWPPCVTTTSLDPVRESLIFRKKNSANATTIHILGPWLRLASFRYMIFGGQSATACSDVCNYFEGVFRCGLKAQGHMLITLINRQSQLHIYGPWFCLLSRYAKTFPESRSMPGGEMSCQPSKAPCTNQQLHMTPTFTTPFLNLVYSDLVLCLLVGVITVTNFNLPRESGEPSAVPPCWLVAVEKESQKSTVRPRTPNQTWIIFKWKSDELEEW